MTFYTVSPVSEKLVVKKSGNFSETLDAPLGMADKFFASSEEFPDDKEHTKDRADVVLGNVESNKHKVPIDAARHQSTLDSFNNGSIAELCLTIGCFAVIIIMLVGVFLLAKAAWKAFREADTFGNYKG